MHFLINLLIAIAAGGLTLYALRSLATTLQDGWRVLIAIIVAIIVFFADVAQYVLTH